MIFKMLTVLACQHRMHELRPFLQRVVDEHPRGCYTVEGIIAKYYTAEWTCWVVEDEDSVVKAVFATVAFSDMLGRINMKVVFMVGEEREKWWHLWDQWVEFARQNGVRRIEIVGRKGLARTLPGFVNEYYVLTKELEPFEAPLPNVNDVGRA